MVVFCIDLMIVFTIISQKNDTQFLNLNLSSKLLIIVSTKKPGRKNERKQFDLSFLRIVKFYPWVFYYIFISNHKCIHSFLCCHHFDIELKTFDSNKFEFKHCVPYFNFLSFGVIQDAFHLDVNVL